LEQRSFLMKTAKTDAQLLIERLKLQPLPLEGGYFRETYRSQEKMAGALPCSQKSVSTCIYFLLTEDTFSAFHRLPADEIWHFYAGDAVELYRINKEGKLEITKLTSYPDACSAPQVVVHAGQWQAARLLTGGKFALLGCTVAPGFDFVDYEHGQREVLLKEFPQYTDEILTLTRS